MAKKEQIEIKPCSKCNGEKGEPVLSRTASNLFQLVKCPCGNEGEAGYFSEDTIMNWNRENDK